MPQRAAFGYRTLTAAALFALALTAPARADVPAPILKSIELAQPLPLPYHDETGADEQVTAALQRARQSGKRVLIDLGGNWCGDCRVFAAIIDRPDVKSFVDRYYEVVMVNVGRFNANLDVPARFGITKLVAAPSVLIVSPSGALLNGDDIVALQDARSMTPQAVVDWLAHWAAPIGG